MSYKFFSSVGMGSNPVRSGVKESSGLRLLWYRFQPQRALLHSSIDGAVELPCGIIAMGRGRKGMSSEEGGNITVVPRPQLSGDLKVRTEVFEKINCIGCPKFV